MARIDIKYYNTVILNGGTNPNYWHVEESRIKGGFNEKSMDYGVRAYIVNEDYEQQRRPNALTYSGIYNSRTGVNETNMFSSSENITKALNFVDGSIQKLYAEDTNLLVFQEDKVSRVLADKDAIYSAEGGGTVTSSTVVLGQTVPYAGRYGISKNPESFAVFGGRKYFTDKNRGLVMRLSQDGMTPISDYGMRSWFNDEFKLSNKLYGAYDTHDQKYVLSIWKDDGHSTLAFDELVKGWVSFYSYRPTFSCSLNNTFYTFDGPNLWEHDINSIRNSFYGITYPSNVEFIANQDPSINKVFHTVSYEGSPEWKLEHNKTSEGDEAYMIATSSERYYNGPNLLPKGFVKKDGEYHAYLKQKPNNTKYKPGEIIFGKDMSGIKGFFTTVKMSTDATTKQELFTVSHIIASGAN